ncbi:MAG: hypothetical protein KDB03_10830 [Planctomycetales bacterium]|nr:hypothetical protein [Planctomycetales bacterium]
MTFNFKSLIGAWIVTTTLMLPARMACMAQEVDSGRTFVSDVRKGEGFPSAGPLDVVDSGLPASNSDEYQRFTPFPVNSPNFIEDNVTTLRELPPLPSLMQAPDPTPAAALNAVEVSSASEVPPQISSVPAGGSSIPGVLPMLEEFDARPGIFGIPGRRCLHCGATSQPLDPDNNPVGMCQVCGHDVRGKPAFGLQSAFRLGWWAPSTRGNAVKIGEFQSLSASPFWDLDSISTSRSQTLDLSLSGLDNEANSVRSFFYGSGLTAKFEYEKFWRQLDHIPPPGFDLDSGSPGPTDKVVSEDTNVGEDYAIRVQQLNTTIKGQITPDLKWKLDLWGMRKSGERQANAMAHCFNINTPPAGADRTCHVLSQRQQIDWTTLEVTPGLEARVGKSTVEYSRNMRTFGQNDQVVDRTYTAFNFSPAFDAQGDSFVYGWVPESFTRTDRFKMNVPLNDVNQLYSHFYFGNTDNKFRETHRQFNGLDIRLTNSKFQNIKLVAYSKLDKQRNDLPSTYLTASPYGANSGTIGTFEPSSLRHPIDYTGFRGGLKGNWQSPSRHWLSMTAGYEYFGLGRKFAQYNTLAGTFSQEDTQTHQIQFGPYVRVSPTLDTYIRYKGGFMFNPLIGVREADGQFNTNQPERVHRVEVGGTWHPTSNFLATTMFGIENSWHDSQYAHFDEDKYPILFTVWYAPTSRLSLSGGYAFLSNWIDQDITIGFLNSPTETSQWNYDGFSNLVNANANFSYTERTQLQGGFEWSQGSNSFFTPASTAGANWSSLPTYSNVNVQTRRVNLGVDHQIRPNVGTYFRYSHFDYEDVSAPLNSGTLDLFLSGLSIVR